MTNLQFQIDNFMLYCTSRNLAKKTLVSYEQTLKLFALYLQEHFQIEDTSKVQSGHIRQIHKILTGAWEVHCCWSPRVDKK